MDTSSRPEGAGPAAAGEDPALARVWLTVTELNRTVAGSLERQFGLLRVRGELASLTRAASGHWYFTLKDDNAQVRCVMFRSRNMLVDFTPKEGDELELLGRAGLYEARGEFQIGIESMRRAGQGRLFEQFMRLKERLAAEGLFDTEAKRPIPRFPSRIGVVTSLKAAALHDIVTTLRRRAPYASLIVYPVPVQGAGASARIAQMLQAVSRRSEVDVVILARGGGSLEDLWAFNEEPVARAIRACAVPVIVGVGHESDVTIADFAADLRAPTPTAAAELAAPDRGGLLEALQVQVERLGRRVQAVYRSRAQTVDHAVRVLATPRAPIRSTRQKLEMLASRLRRAAAFSMAGPSGRLAAARRALDALDPRGVLARGYAIVRDGRGVILCDASRAAVGSDLDIELTTGALRARVQSVRARDA